MFLVEAKMSDNLNLPDAIGCYGGVRFLPAHVCDVVSPSRCYSCRYAGGG